MHAKHPEIAAKWDAEIRNKKKHKCGPDCDHAVQKNDPFEINKARVPKLNTGLSTAQKVGRKAKKAVKHTYQNATSKKTYRQPYTGAKFGSRDDTLGASTEAKKLSFRTGLVAGTVGGSIASTAVHSPEIHRNNKKIQELSKARSSLITDVGTVAGKARKYPGFRAGRFAGGVATGAGVSYGLGSAEVTASQNELKRAQTNKKRRDTIAAKKKASTTVAKQDYGKPTAGRYAAGYAFNPVHGLVAGKKGHKLRAAGNELGGATLGSIAGSAAGAALTRGKSAPAIQAGGAAGAIGGVLGGVKRAQSKGHYKPQKVQKNDSISAFGVDHGY